MNWNDKFESFVKKKVAAASEAHIHGFRTLERSSAEKLGLIAGNWVEDLYDGPFFVSEEEGSDLPLVNTVFVQTKDGNTGADNPGDLGGGETDKHLIYEGLSRVDADAVLAGANTIRGSGIVLSVWHPMLTKLRQDLGLPKHPAQIVVSGSGRIDMDQELMFNVPMLRVFVLTTDEGMRVLEPHLERRPWIKALSTGKDIDLTKALRQLKAEFGIKRISAIGGRTVTTQLIDAGLVKDLYLTTSNILGGEPNTPYYTGDKEPDKKLVTRKIGKGQEEGVVFEHFVYE